MPIIFPTSPTVGQVFSQGGRSWVWNGSTWDSPSADNLTTVLATKANINANWARSDSTATTVSTTTPTIICSLTITTNGRPVFLNATGDMNPTVAPPNWNFLQIYRGETQIGKRIISESSANSLNVPWALTTIDSPAAGTHTYTVRAWQGAGTQVYGETGNIQAPTIVAFELF